MKKFVNKIDNFLGRKLKKLLKKYDNNIFKEIPDEISSYVSNCNISDRTKLYKPYQLTKCNIGKGTYIAQNSVISMTDIGKYCSIGPNLMCGFGIHPTSGISTSPAFYSNLKQNGISFSKENKIIERKNIKIGNDVFIGMNVSILDGVTICDGAVIAAGAVVIKDVKPYEIVGGVPAKHIKYRFSDEIIKKLLKIKWWDFDDEKIKDVEKMFFDVEKFIQQYSKD